MTKVTPFPTLITHAPLVAIDPLPRIFLWIAPSIAHADGIVANGAKKFLAKGTPPFTNGQANLPNKATRNLRD